MYCLSPPSSSLTWNVQQNRLKTEFVHKFLSYVLLILCRYCTSKNIFFRSKCHAFSFIHPFVILLLLFRGHVRSKSAYLHIHCAEGRAGSSLQVMYMRMSLITLPYVRLPDFIDPHRKILCWLSS